MEGGSMDLTKISSSDRIVLVGFVLTFIGTLGPWWVVSYGIGGTSSANRMARDLSRLACRHSLPRCGGPRA